MYTDTLKKAVISVDFSGFRSQDDELFERFLKLWFKMANGPLAVRHAPYDHLMKVLNDNTMSLGEQSDTISDKWISLLATNQIWKAFIYQSPFKLSIQKV